MVEPAQQFFDRGGQPQFARGCRVHPAAVAVSGADGVYPDLQRRDIQMEMAEGMTKAWQGLWCVTGAERSLGQSFVEKIDIICLREAPQATPDAR